MKQLNEQDRQRIEINNPHGKGAWYEFNAWKQGAEYEHNYQRERLTKENAAKDEEITKLKQQITNHTAINSLLAGDEPEVELANKVFQQSEQINQLKAERKELVEALRDFDELLAMMEDYSHGEEGRRITKARGKIESLLNNQPDEK